MELSLLSEATRDITPPCVGKWVLFDSVFIEDHEQAAALCAECPMVAECKTLLNQARTASHTGGRPSGTWAGQLIGGDAETRAKRVAEEDARFTPEQALAANRRHSAGARDRETMAGRRVYERTRLRALRARRRDAA